MPRGREPAAGLVPTRLDRAHGRFAGSWAGSLVLGASVTAATLLLASGCPGRTDGPAGDAQPPAGEGHGLVSPWKDGIGNVGNQVRGIEAMPDYDAEARHLRARVVRQLPEPLPSPKAACVSMLDGARQYYVDTEGEESSAVRTMEATRTADLAACVDETSPAAAACVAVLMGRNEGEFPWVLDQCSRAFPQPDRPG
ncbi:hypothetical protein [Paraliomyxa miuraensis]|uniref:hypothetical protein n=1 Tax=Paraliomyxa miuraensis TaxID=376150 RepID=UPI0022543907|nr:hypothetical protein [Paraliomyxa miuraensis]MCX4241722.1 hypothetical protein [Paraliomyxa miuraensis]